MSRTTNEGLTRRILAAAKKLWHQAGEEGLTIRAIAKEAGTTTPSVYQRFPSKHDIVAAIGNEVRLRLSSQVIGAGNLEAACEAYLEIARKQPHEYRLLFGPSLPRLIRRATRRPLLEWLEERLAERLETTRADCQARAYGLFLLLHGAGSLLQYSPRGEFADEIHQRCLAACKALIAAPNGHSPARSR
jgi:AcrR family transcriptional regulator